MKHDCFNPFGDITTPTTPPKPKKRAKHSPYLKGNRFSKELIYYGDHYIPRKDITFHTLSLGSAGTGKSWFLKFSLSSILSHCKKGSGIKVVIIESKGDLLPIAAYFSKKNGVPLHYINPSDLRSIKPQDHIIGSVWDMAKDCGEDPTKIMEAICGILTVPERGDRFWNEFGQILGMCSISADKKIKPTLYGIHSIFQTTFSDKEKLEKILNSTKLGKIVKSQFLNSENEKVRDSVLMTMMATLFPFETACAGQYHTPKKRWLATRDFINGDAKILVIGQDLAASHVSKPIVQTIFKNFVGNASMREERENLPPDIFLFIDELPYHGKFEDLPKVVSFQRSKGVSAYLAAQDFEQIKDVYGDKTANAIANNCDVKIFCRTNSPETANWSVNLTGKYRYLENTPTISFNSNGASSSINRKVVEKSPLCTADLIDMKPANKQNGIYFHFFSPYTDNRKSLCHISPEDVDALKPPSLPVPYLIPKPAKYLRMPNLYDEPANSPSPQLNLNWIKDYLNVSDPIAFAIRSQVLEFFEQQVKQHLKDFFPDK